MILHHLEDLNDQDLLEDYKLGYGGADARVAASILNQDDSILDDAVDDTIQDDSILDDKISTKDIITYVAIGLVLSYGIGSLAYLCTVAVSSVVNRNNVNANNVEPNNQEDTIQVEEIELRDLEAASLGSLTRNSEEKIPPADENKPESSLSINRQPACLDYSLVVPTHDEQIGA